MVIGMDSDNEWNMEQEEPSLPNDNLPMDIQQCFNIEEDLNDLNLAEF